MTIKCFCQSHLNTNCLIYTYYNFRDYHKGCFLSHPIYANINKNKNINLIASIVIYSQ